MNVRIRTAHGYLSFQPDGRIEYRQVAGAWENIDIEGLELQPAPPNPGPGPSPQPPINGPWLGITPSPTAGYVAQIKSYLQSHGVDLSGPCGAFAITKNVAWGLKDQNQAGLLSKPAGNNCDGYATDIICYPGGHIVDILGDGGNKNNPQWAEGEDVEASRYRPPVQP